MADIKKFPTKPYFDDFDENNNFLRVLFRPGYAVQTRELNQIQSILQDQIGVLADYSIPDGSTIIGGAVNLVKKLPFIKFATGTSLARDPVDYKDTTFVAANGITGTIKFMVTAESTDPVTAYVKYDSSIGSVTTPVDGSIVTITFPDFGTEILTLAPSAATGNASGVVMSPGIFYTNKSFVRSEEQLLFIDKYATITESTTESIGIIIEDTIVRPEQEIALLDNATGTPNQSAPGAHRHNCEIILVKKTSVSDIALQTYKELMKIEFGKVAARPRLDSDVAVLEQILARRTFDQSGDYVIDDFVLDVREHLLSGNNRGVYTAGEGGSASKLALQFDPGVAYVKGFEVRTAGNAIVEIPKAQTTKTSSNTLIQTQYGISLNVYDMNFIPKIGAKVALYTSGAVIIGSAFIRGIEYKETKVIGTSKEVFRLDIVNPKFTGSYSWSNITEVRHDAGVGGSVFAALVNSYSIDGGSAKLIYKLPKENASTLLPRVSFFNKEYVTSSTASIITLVAAAGETLDDEISSYMLQHNSYNTTKCIRPTSVSVVGNTATINATSLLGAGISVGSINVIAKTFSSSPVIRTKSLVPNFVNSGLTASASVALTKADAVSLISVVSSTGANVTSSYYLDTGARDAFYDVARIILKNGESVPTGTLTVTYSYFDHGVSGDFFAPDSYASVPYESIPTYTTSTNEKIFLGSAVDYRQRLTAAGFGLEMSGRNSFVANDQLITDITYYLPRMDRVVLTHLGEFKVLQGAPSETPKIRAELPNSITLYDLYIPAYTFKPSDVVISKTKHKRFTMKDIAEMEYRVGNIEEVTLLNSLERDVQSVDFLDRFKSGYIADNFSSQRGADVNDPLHSCAYDLIKKEVRPRSSNANIDLSVLSSSNITTHSGTGGVFTLPYTEVQLVSQLLASDVVRLQPYMLYDWRGTLTLNPSTDSWFDHRAFVNTSINGSFFSSTQVSTELSNETALLGGAWNFVGGVWRQGSSRSSPQQAADLAKDIAASGVALGSTSTSSPFTRGPRLLTTTTTAVSSVSVTSAVSAIPFMRARSISVSATGLKPGARVYPYFDGVNVDQYCTPNGASLVAAGNGTLTLTFALPANTFRTGSRAFVLKDSPNWGDDIDSTSAEGSYNAVGTLITDTTSVAIARTVTQRWYDPVAQSFFVEPDNGVFVSSIDIYFGPAAVRSRYTASVQIRPMVNGYPSSDVIAEKTLPGASCIGSPNGSVATRFTFPYPVYLNGGNEYCFVCESPDDKADIWISTLGRRSYRSVDTTNPTGEIISKQPFLGSMFKSQNSTTWTAEQTQDVKFVINKCNFQSSGNVVFRNGLRAADVGGPSDIYKELLVPGPLNFTSGSNTVRIKAYGHGFIVGDTITLTKSDAATGGPYHGALHTNLFGVPLTITAVRPGSVDVTVAGTITSTGSAGGSNVYANWVIDYSYAQLLSDAIAPIGTNITYTLQGKTKANYAAGVNATTYEMNDEEIFDLGTTFVAKSSTDGGLQLTAALSTTDSNLSPVIYRDRLSVHVMKNVISDVTYLNSGGTKQTWPSPAAYVQNTVTLAQAANELRVIFGANIPSGTSVEVYYKVSQADIADAGEWKRLPVVNSLAYSDNPSEFREQNFLLEFGVNGVTPTYFSVFKIMVQLVSSDPTRVPRIKDYRALALAR